MRRRKGAAIVGLLGALGCGLLTPELRAQESAAPEPSLRDESAEPEASPVDPLSSSPSPPSPPSALPAEPEPAPEDTSPSGPDLTSPLSEAALDLGIVARVVPAEELDRELFRRGPSETAPWLIGHRVSPSEAGWRVEVTAIPPGSRVRRVAVDVVEADRLEVRSIVLLRDAVQVPTSTPRVEAPPEEESAPPPPRSSGRAVLALNTALLGGAIGVSLHRAGTSEDDRLLYPLAALGVGIGLGASMLVADEWDITTDDAWFLSAGMVWPAASGVLIAAGHDVPEESRYLYGLSGTAIGVTLASVVVAQHRVYEGSATLAHSGAAFGLGMGALAEGIFEGDLVNTPLRGMGYGAGIGVLAAGLAASQVDTSSSRVLLVDLSALLGGLTGGALATPLLLADDLDDTRRRLWFGSIAAGTAAGALVGVFATRSADAPSSARDLRSGSTALVERWSPSAGVMALTPEGVPAYGAGVQGLW